MMSSIILLVSIVVIIGLVALIVIAERTMSEGLFSVTAILSTLVIALSAFIFVTNLSYFGKNRTGLPVGEKNVTSSELKFKIEELEGGVFAIHNAKNKEVVVRKEGGKTYKMYNDTFMFVYDTSNLEPGIYETKINRTHNYCFFGKKTETVEYKIYAVVLSENMVKEELGSYNANKSLKVLTSFEAFAAMFALVFIILNIVFEFIETKSHLTNTIFEVSSRASSIIIIAMAILALMSIIGY